MAKPQSLGARQKPPESIKAIYKHFQKLSIDTIQEDIRLLDFQRGLTIEQKTRCRKVETVLGQNVMAACLCFRHYTKQASELFPDVPVFEHEDARGEAMNAVEVWKP